MKQANTYLFSKTGFFSNYTLEADFENPIIEPNGAGVKIDGWTHYSPSTTLSVEPHNGSDWLKVVSTNGTHGAHQGFSVEPGETYTFEIDLHRPAGMNKEINVVIWKNTGPSGALSIHVLNTDGSNTFNYTATSSNIYIQIRQAGTYYLDNIRMYRTYQDTVFVGGFEMDMAYRYGFQGQEKDNEVSGKGNSYTAEFWQYSPRLGKRWNIDPVVKPHESPYATFANNPIWFIDPSGADTIGYSSAVNKMPEGSKASNDLIEKSSAFVNFMSKLNGVYSQVDVVFKTEDMGDTDEGSVSLLYKGELVDKNFKFDSEASLSDFSLLVVFNSKSTDPLRQRKDNQAESTITIAHELGIHVNDFMELLFGNSNDGLVNTEAILKYFDYVGQMSPGHLKHGNGKAVLYNAIMNEVLVKWESIVFQTVKVNESMYFSKPNGLTTWGGVYKGFLNSYGETRPSNQQELRYWDLLKHSLDKDISTSKSYFQNIR